jgi:hypothetical protein
VSADNNIINDVAALLVYDVIIEDELLIVLNKIRLDFGVEPNLEEIPKTILDLVDLKRSVVDQTLKLFKTEGKLSELLDNYVKKGGE